jgi:hypothetical protein
MPTIVYHNDVKIGPYIKPHFEFFPFEPSPLGDMTFTGDVSAYLKPLQPPTFEQLLVEIAAAPDNVLLYCGHGNPTGLVNIPITAGGFHTPSYKALNELLVLEKFIADRKTLLNTRPPAPKPTPGQKGPPPKDQATKDFLKKVADLVHDMQDAMIKIQNVSGQPINVSRLKQNIDNDTPDIWDGYDFGTDPKPPQDLVKWCDKEFSNYLKLYDFPSFPRIEQFYDRVRAARAKGIRLEVRACRVGQKDWVKTMQRLLGPSSKVTAPVCYVAFGYLGLHQIRDQPRAHIDALDEFKRRIREAQASRDPKYTFRLFDPKLLLGSVPLPMRVTLSGRALHWDQPRSPQPLGSPRDYDQVDWWLDWKAGREPQTPIATLLVTTTEISVEDLHDANTISWFVRDTHLDFFIVDYGMDGKPGFRIPRGKTKLQAVFQYFWTDDIANRTNPNDPLPSLPDHGFNVPYQLGTALVKPMVFPGDYVYRKLINSEPPWYPKTP